MRFVFAALLYSFLVGCASAPATAPREYLDEQTAATITAVKEPWIFTREQNVANGQRDFLHLYAIDVNRMGEHRQYIAALQSSAGDTSIRPILELTAGGQTHSLEALSESPREIGIAQPIAQSYALTSAWWFYPVDKQTLAALANARDLRAQMVVGNEPIGYALWRDGREELSELTAVLP
jgi:hypothetical protein